MIDDESEFTVYQQIAAVIRARIEAGEYRRRLPTVTAFEQEFGVARNTVLQAMAHLRDLNIIYTVRNRGSFVRVTTTAEVSPEPGMRIFARMPSETEIEDFNLGEQVPVLVIERTGGKVEVLPADSSEIRIPE